MQKKIFRRSFTALSAWCVALAVFGASFVQAAEFKPFMTMQIAGPNTLVSIAERVAGVLALPDTDEFLVQAALYRDLPGVNAAGNIGLAIAASEESAIGVEAIIALPISDLATFNIPGMEEQIVPFRMMAMMMRQGNRYTFPTPFGNIAAYQREGFLLIATEGAAGLVATANPATIFAEVEDFTLGVHINLENITEETIQMIVSPIAMMLAMQGMDVPGMHDLGAIIDPVMEALEEMASITYGITIDPATLNLTSTSLTVAKPGTEMAERFARLQEAQANTRLGAFLVETPQTILTYHWLYYFTDSEIEMMRTMWEGISDGLMEGIYDILEDEIAEGEQLEQLIEAVELLFGYVEDIMDFTARERLLEFSYWLDSEGTFIAAMGTDKTAEIVAHDERFYGRLVEIFGLETFIAEKIMRDYATIAGYSLSAIPNILADLPLDLPAEVQEVLANIPLSLFWAVKEGEAVVYAFGFDFDRAEATVKAALARTQTPTAPAQTAYFAAAPFAEFFMNKILPLLPPLGETEAEMLQAVVSALMAAAPNDKAILVEEYSSLSILQTIRVDGALIIAFFDALLRPAVTAAQGAAARMQCSNNIRIIVLALHNYHDSYNALPPLHSVDADGNPLHSWRVHLLPFIEQGALYQQIRLDEPWDSAHNRQFHNVVIPHFRCPANPLVTPGMTTYSVIAGQVFTPATATTPGGRMPRGNTFSVITDGTSNTIAIVEVREPFNWMDPTADITLEEFATGINVRGGRAGSFHTGGINVGFFDGSARFVSDTIAPAILRALGNPRSGQSVSL